MAAPSGIKWGSIVTGSKSTRKGRIGIYAGVTETATQVKVNVQVWFWSMYSVDDSSNSYYYNTGSTTATTLIGSKDINHTVSSGDGWSTSNQTKLGEASYTYNKGTSASTKYYAAKFTGIDTLYASSVMTVSTSVTVPALASYKIAYNANGGSGAPGSQTKYYGKNITLSSTKPTRTGYSFQGWSTANDSSVEYAAGATYSGNAALTLYAVWKANTYTVSYNANGGSGAPGNQTKTYGVNLTLSSTKPTRANYNFKGWATSSNGAVVYQAGGSYTSNAAVTLYAVWELAYVIPRITGLTATRCDKDGNASESGTYAKVAFSWATDKAVSSIKIEWKRNSDTSWSSATISASGTSGSPSQVIGAGGLNAEYAYTIRVTVSDASGSNNKSVTINGQIFPIDFLAGGNGVAFGKAAENANEADFNYPIRARKGLQSYGTNTITSTADDTTGNWGQYGFSYHFYTATGQLIDQPSQWGYLLNIGTGTEIHQLWLTQASGDLHHRGGNGSGWSGTWRKILDSSNYSNYALPLTGGNVSGTANVSGVSAFNWVRFNNSWVGFYSSHANAINGTSRLGWIGHNDTTHLNITNEAGGNIILKSTGAQIDLTCKSCTVTLDYSNGSTYNGYFIPVTTAKTTLGTTNYRWYGLYSSQACNTSSDERLKSNIIPMNSELAIFLSGNNSNIFENIFSLLNPVAFSLNIEDNTEHEGRMHFGFIAQEVEKALEDNGLDEKATSFVTHSFWTDKETGEEKDEYSLRYEEFIALNTHMIQKQQAKIQSLESEVTSLKNELAELKKLINTLVKSA